jgi:tRNA-dihydrouridine synthase B
MRIGSLEAGKVFLAPLSGVADSPFRRICKSFGVDAVWSEMISAVGLTKGNWRSRALMDFHEEERPIGIQLFGRDPGSMAEAARIVEERQPDFIDINLSCPAGKIVSRGSGSALLREPDRAADIARAVVGAVSLPVTAKIRIGWDRAQINAVDIARMLEGCGIVAVSVHGRTWEQGFRERASWSDVARVKQAVRIPVVLSGDVTSPEEAARAFEETGCDAVMIGRGSFGRPWVFAAVASASNGGGFTPPGPGAAMEIALRHLDLGIEEFGERIAVRRFRKHLLWYTKGMPGVVRLREVMCKVSSRADACEIFSRLVQYREEPGVTLG